MTDALYIDNNHELLPAIRYFCEQIGAIELTVVRSGEEALGWLSLHPAAAIISEYELPGMSGIRLLETLHSLGIMTPFILFTSCKSPFLKKMARDAGAFGIIVRDGTGKKPVLQLMRMLNWVIEKDR